MNVCSENHYVRGKNWKYNYNINLMDLYIFTPNKNIFDKFKKLKNTNIYNITCYCKPKIIGLPTENILFRIMNKECFMISKEIPNYNDVLGIIIKPKLDDITVNMENFIIYNLHNDEYLKEVFGNDLFYEIFKEHGHNNLKLMQKFKEVYNKFGNEIMRVNENYEEMIKSKLPFNYILLNEEDVDNYINNNKNTEIIKSEKNFNYSNNTYKNNSEPINYLTMATIGMGDFIQRFERIYKLLNFANTSFKPIKNMNFSYNNSSHGSSKYLRMYDFPGFEFIEKRDNIKECDLINIQFQTLVELLLYDKNFFEDFPRNKIMYINAGSYIINSQKRPIIAKMFNWNNDQKYMKEIHVPYSQPDWDYIPFSKNKLAIMHFRRDDYIEQLFSNRPNPRTMNTFFSLLNKLTLELYSNKIFDIDVVILSDHYNMNKLTDQMKKYKKIVFDYDEFECNKVFYTNGVHVIIRDKILGTNAEANYETLRYLSNCDYHIGNMSCFPHMMYNIFKNKKVKEIRIGPNIRNMEDVKRIYETL